MRPNLRLVALIVAVMGLQVAISAARPAGVPDAEVARIQAHLAAVESTLRARDASAMRPEQRQARAELLDVLREYRHAGRFPHNHVQSGLTPVFRDAHGTLCAVGYLIERSGRGDIVDAVAARRNLGSVPEIAADPVLGPALVQWLAGHGFTVEEAARIQPMYGTPPPERDSGSGDVGSSVVAAGLGFASGVVGVASDDRTARVVTGIVGLASGVVQLGMARGRLDADGDRWTLGQVNIVGGVVSAMLGGLNLALAGGAGRDLPPVRATVDPSVDGTGVGLEITF